MNEKIPYTELAKYYDMIYSYKNYKKESNVIINLIKKYKKSSGSDLLESACGTGEYLKYFLNDYNCEGFDISSDMISVAKEKLPEINFRVADMTNFNFNKKYDVIVCLFSSIAYIKTVDNLKKAINNFYEHLNDGGIMIIEPWFEKESFFEGRTSLITYNSDDIKIARTQVLEIVDDISVLNMDYLIAQKDKKTIHFKDKHELALFNYSEILKIMRDFDLKSKYYEKGIFGKKKIFIGVKK